MKKMWVMMSCLLLAAAIQAGLAPTYLPSSSYYQGRHSFAFDLGAEGVLSGHLEFAVYKGTEAEVMMDWTGYEGQAQYVYAYQVFNDGANSNAALTYFALTGINPGSIGSVTEDIGQAESVGTFDSEGIAPEGNGYFDAAVTKAIWTFADGTLIKGTQSWFLFLYSNYDWIKGGMEVQPTQNDDIPIPDDGNNNIPEPATMLLLVSGIVLSQLRKNK